jgi:hypothetical protein
MTMIVIAVMVRAVKVMIIHAIVHAIVVVAVAKYEKLVFVQSKKN